MDDFYARLSLTTLLWVMSKPSLQYETRQRAWQELCLRMARD